MREYRSFYVGKGIGYRNFETESRMEKLCFSMRDRQADIAREQKGNSN
jgi:hypothetical protein